MEVKQEHLDFFAAFVRSQLGIVYKSENYYQLESRIRDISVQLGFESPQKLYESAKVGITDAMRLLILDIATNNETQFFRDPSVFDAFEKNILTDPLFQNLTEPLTIWSAACSSGQEPYSIAMLLSKSTVKLPYGFKIVATDISQRILDRARSGSYSQLEIQRGLPAVLLVRHFDKIDSNGAVNFQVKAELKKQIDFRALNLIKPFPPNLPQFHIILCRNVLIYQDIESKKAIIARIMEKLVPGGFFIMGGAESLIGLYDGLEQIRHANAVIYRKTLVNQSKKAC
jgi:chemotaxis protein methyltransferase CheR